MPYVITTYAAVVEGDGVTLLTADGEIARPRAVATLDEAYDHVAALGYPTVALRVPDGGTIGPLPDGTTVEVEFWCWMDVARSGGSRHLTNSPDHVQSYAILDSYNNRTEI